MFAQLPSSEKMHPDGEQHAPNCRPTHDPARQFVPMPRPSPPCDEHSQEFSCTHVPLDRQHAPSCGCAIALAQLNRNRQHAKRHRNAAKGSARDTMSYFPFLDVRCLSAICAFRPEKHRPTSQSWGTQMRRTSTLLQGTRNHPAKSGKMPDSCKLHETRATPMSRLQKEKRPGQRPRAACM